MAALSQSPAIFFSPACREGILAHLRSERTELGGLLLGSAYVPDDDLRALWGPIVSIDVFLPSERFRSSGVSLSMDAEVWDRARAHIDRGRGIVVGWYHSHPNLGAFFSVTDRRTQRAFFNAEYSLGLVIDPIRRREAWFLGGEAEQLDSRAIHDCRLSTEASL
ncbi:MAG TPA: Mov34/MPN/PAD-1 family protein [Vicinamibacterales bacterium]|nr:Mov34/MPN/PAD-1 family protein [Vicinamibacterales bacterium]